MTLRERSEEKDGGRFQREKMDLEPLPLFLHCITQLPIYLVQVIFVILYNSWLLVLRKLLRVVTVLEVSSPSSSSFTSRTLLKNLKMELKLIQDVSSCLSVPTWNRYT